MMSFFLLAISTIAVILLCKIAELVYDDYIRRKKLSHIPQLTSLPFIGTLALLRQTEKGRMNWFLSLLHKFKDGIFLLWAGPRPLVYIYKPELLKVILSSTVYIEKSKHYLFFSEWLGDGLLLSKEKKWARDRKLLSPSFHLDINQFSATMSEKTEVMLKFLERAIAENPEEAIDILPIIDNLSIEIVCETVMGINVHNQEVKSTYIDSVQRLLQLILLRINRPWLWVDWIFNLTGIGRKYNKTLRKLHAFTRDVIQKKRFVYKLQKDKFQNNHDDFDMTDKPKRRALLELLLDLNDNETNLLSDEELRIQVDTFMFAAYDTTSTTLSWVLFCLGNNLEHQEKLHEEIDNVFQDSREPATTKQLSQLKYLDRIMKESIRLYPTVPLFSRQITDDINLGGYVIPKDTSVFISIMLLHRDPKTWPDPLKFDPDRFLPENMKRRHPYAFIPFSAGPRNCIGQRYALLEEKIVLTAILRKWKIKSVETPAELNIYDTNVLRPYRGVIRVHFSPKK